MTSLTFGIYRYMPSFSTWLHQNAAEPLDCYEGCLLDNCVYACKRGYAFVYERYLNEFTSYYAVEFVPYKDETNALKLWDVWERRCHAAEDAVEGE